MPSVCYHSQGRRPTSTCLAEIPEDNPPAEPDSKAAVAVPGPPEEVAIEIPEAGAVTLAPEAVDGETGTATGLPPPDHKQEVMVAIRLAVRPDLPGPIRGVCVDLDLHRGLGVIHSVSLLFGEAQTNYSLQWQQSARHL